MAKDLPYFKFYCSEWTDGDITLEDLKTQGLFINVCSYYWSRECQVSLQNIQKRFRNNSKQLQNLLKAKIIKEDGDSVLIQFLDKQWVEREKIKHRNQKNGKGGGRPKITQSVIGINPVETNIEEKRREEKREEHLRDEPEDISKTIDPEETAKPEADSFSKFCETYPKPFNPMCSYTKAAFYEAVSIADGDDPILVNASMYANYFKKINKPLQYAPSAQKWLETQSWRTDWNAEAVKEKNNGKKGMSNSKPSDIQPGDVF